MDVKKRELKKKLAIIILNYNAYQETIQCVDSILANQMKFEGIVIVDNASENVSVSHLRKRYAENSKIVIIKNNLNNGFAKGNNLGIKIAKRIWKANFILLLNSDTIILQKDYIDRMFRVYEQGVAVIQSNALRTNGRYTSKSYGTYSVKGLVRELFSIVCDTFDLYYPLCCRESMELEPHISGCDIMLTPSFFEKFNGLYPLTFLFMEESILKIMLKKAGLINRVAEDACLLHKESMSTPLDMRIGSKVRRKLECIGKLHTILVRIMPIELVQRIINRGEW